MEFKYSDASSTCGRGAKLSILKGVFLLYILFVSFYTLLAQDVSLRQFFAPGLFVFSLAIVLLYFYLCLKQNGKVSILSTTFSLMLIYHFLTTSFLFITHPGAIYQAIIYGSSPFLIFMSVWALMHLKEINISRVSYFITLIFTPLVVISFIYSGRFDLANIEASRVSNISNVAASFLIFSLLAQRGAVLRILQIVLALIVILGMKRSGIFFIGLLLTIYLFSGGSTKFIARMLGLAVLSSIFVYFNLDRITVFFDLIVLRVENIADGGSGRSDIWSQVMDYYGGQNIVSKIGGNGFGTFSISVMPGYAASHNDLLDFVINYGLIGILFLVFIFFRLIYLVLNLNRTYFSLASMSLISYFIIYSSVAGIFYFYMYFSFFFVLLAVLEFEAQKRKLCGRSSLGREINSITR